MTTKPDVNDDESFIILGSSPGTSLDLKCNGMDAPSLDRLVLDDAIKDLPAEPSPASLMIASTMITDYKSTEELQKQFGELLDENVILKETLKKNNESMKEQFLLIASCQEDMMKTHVMHKEKFDETRELVEKLRQENKKLKSDIARLAESEPSRSIPEGSSGQSTSGPTSALEFVTSPDDDTINKLTAQLELVEKQRRQVIVENEKLTWQKESLEHIVDATTKERDELKDKVKALELQLSNIESEHTHKINLLNYTIQDLNNKLETAKTSIPTASPEELGKRDDVIKQLEGKICGLQNDLKQAQLKILELETVKLEFSKHKSGAADTVKLYKDQIQELHNRLKEAQTTVFQPVRCSVSMEGDSGSSEYGAFMGNVKLYDKTLKHLAELLNLIIHGNLSLLVHLQECRFERSNTEVLRASLTDLRQRVDSQHAAATSNVAQVKGALSIFEGIFKDYNELLKKCLNKQEPKPAPSVEQLTAALVARGQELQDLQCELASLKVDKEEKQLLQAQLELYKSDFEAEREAREKMASEKETTLTDLRTTLRRNQELVMQLEEVRKLNPNIFRSATAKRLQPNVTSQPTGGSTSGPTRATGGSQEPPGSRRQAAPGNTATGNMVRKKQKVDNSEDREKTPPPLRYDCPVCDKPFKTLLLLQQHVDSCLL
ncbi:optineurin isoform X2 [Pectinophora gossypiella]|uniref:optineurin isoform X2 n=1 Tax=Pectinophora gossypiella TaxID=13191 RepID=UPI00214E0156|nr:optineurin isoform X2 [Pectinophora gossypiella]